MTARYIYFEFSLSSNEKVEKLKKNQSPIYEGVNHLSKTIFKSLINVNGRTIALDKE